MPKTIGIIGARRRDTLKDYLAVRAAFDLHYADGDTIVSGGCPAGGDRFAEMIAIDLCKIPELLPLGSMGLFRLSLSRRHAIIKSYGAPIKLHLADWNTYGRSAGFHRNTFIAADSDILIACVAPDRKGGTEDSIRKFLACGKHPEDLFLV